MSVTPIQTIPIVTTIQGVYDTNSFTGIELASATAQKVNEVIEAMNTLSLTITEQIDASVAQQIAIFIQDIENNIEDLKIYVDTKDGEIYNYLNTQLIDIRSEINTFKNSINSSIANFNIQFNTFKTFVQSQLSNFISYVDAQNTLQNNNVNARFNAVYETIDNLELEYPPILNPATGLMSSIQQVLASIYSILSVNAMNCTEFDAELKTCTELEAYNLTTTQFDTQSKVLIV